MVPPIAHRIERGSGIAARRALRPFPHNLSLPRRRAYVVTTVEIRSDKPDRSAFRAAHRLPVQVVLDGVQRAYNLGAIFRLCDAMLVERLIVCEAPASAAGHPVVRLELTNGPFL